MKFILKFILIASAASAFLVSVFVSIIEWFENASSIFHDESGTNWNFVVDTFFSWFWPTLLVTLPIAVVVAFVWVKMANRKNA